MEKILLEGGPLAVNLGEFVSEGESAIEMAEEGLRVELEEGKLARVSGWPGTGTWIDGSGNDLYHTVLAVAARGQVSLQVQL